MGRKKKYDKVGRPPKHRPVYIVELGEAYPSYEAAASRVGGNRGNVLLCLEGDRKTHKGFTFKYCDIIVDGEDDSK